MRAINHFKGYKEASFHFETTLDTPYVTEPLVYSDWQGTFTYELRGNGVLKITFPVNLVENKIVVNGFTIYSGIDYNASFIPIYNFTSNQIIGYYRFSIGSNAFTIQTFDETFSQTDINLYSFTFTLRQYN